MRIAVDTLGGDAGPGAVVQGAAIALLVWPGLEVDLFGPGEQLAAEVASLPRHLAAAGSRLSVYHAPESIRSDQRPSDALRRGDASSMALMLGHVAVGHAVAGVSAGNTGALMALARRALGTVAQVPRPAICTAIPTHDEGRCYLLDLGANVDVSARRQVDFARMGEIMAGHVDGLEAPRVALLNVGGEATKGNESVREADVLLQQLNSLNYIGFVEGDGIFAGSADVVVCDGFVGNAVLKASEGLARMLIARVQATFESHLGSRLVGRLAQPALRRLQGELDPVRYNGASLLGLDGIVVKSHGSASATGFSYAVLRAAQEVSQGLPARLAQELNGRHDSTQQE